jgi:hypothetical protein
MARSYSPKLDKSTSRQPTYNYVDYTDVAHFRALGQSMNCFRENDELCDVTLLVEGQKIRAHKIILAAASPYFKAMFTGRNCGILVLIKPKFFQLKKVLLAFSL